MIVACHIIFNTGFYVRSLFKLRLKSRLINCGARKIDDINVSVIMRVSLVLLKKALVHYYRPVRESNPLMTLLERAKVPMHFPLQLFPEEQ